MAFKKTTLHGDVVFIVLAVDQLLGDGNINVACSSHFCKENGVVVSWDLVGASSWIGRIRPTCPETRSGQLSMPWGEVELHQVRQDCFVKRLVKLLQFKELANDLCRGGCYLWIIAVSDSWFSKAVADEECKEAWDGWQPSCQISPSSAFGGQIDGINCKETWLMVPPPKEHKLASLFSKFSTYIDPSDILYCGELILGCDNRSWMQ